MRIRVSTIEPEHKILGIYDVIYVNITWFNICLELGKYVRKQFNLSTKTRLNYEKVDD